MFIPIVVDVVVDVEVVVDVVVVVVVVVPWDFISILKPLNSLV